MDVAFGPPKAAFEVAKVALLVDAWTPELTLDVSFDTIDKVIEVELDRKKRTVVISMKAKEEAGINKTSVMAEDKERREEEKSVDDARLNEIFTELGLEIRKNRFGGSVNSYASMLRDWVARRHRLFSKQASEAVISVLKRRGIQLLVDDRPTSSDQTYLWVETFSSQHRLRSRRWVLTCEYPSKPAAPQDL